MKKLVVPVLCLALLLTVFPAFAELPGEEVRVVFNPVSQVDNVDKMQIGLEFDENILELQRVTVDGKEPPYGRWLEPRSFEAEFRVREDARPGVYTVTARVKEASDREGNLLGPEQFPVYAEAAVTVKHPPVEVSVYYYVSGWDKPLLTDTVILEPGTDTAVDAVIPEGYVSYGPSNRTVSVSDDGKAVPESVSFLLATCTPAPTPAPTPSPTPSPEEMSQTDRNALIMERLSAAGLAWPADETALAEARSAAAGLERYLYAAFPGDLNNDGAVDMLDAELMDRYLLSVSAGAKGAPDEEGIERLMNGDLDGDGLVTEEDRAALGVWLDNLLSDSGKTRDSFILATLREEGIPWPLTEEERASALARLPFLNGYLYVGLKGDLDGDGEVKVNDFVILQRLLEGNGDVNAERYANGDMNGDYQITSADLLLLQ